MNVGEHFPENSPQMLGAFACFGCVLREVLQDRPKIDESSPVDVPEIRQEQVRFVVVQQWIVPREEEVEKIRTVRMNFDESLNGSGRTPEFPWKQIAAERLLSVLVCTSTRMLSRYWQTMAVRSVPLTRFQQSDNETLQAGKVWTRLREKAAKSGMQSKALRLCKSVIGEEVKDEVISFESLSVFARMGFRDVGRKKSGQLLLCLFPGGQEVYILTTSRPQRLATRFVFENSFKVRVSRHVALSMSVRIAVFAKLKAKPVEKRLFRTGRDDVRHDIADKYFHSKRMQLHNQIWMAQNPLAAILQKRESLCVAGRHKLRSSKSLLCKRSGAGSSGIAEAMEFIEVVVWKV